MVNPKRKSKWFTSEIEITRYNFIWLLDVFAFALVNLTGTGIAAMSADTQIASVAAFASIVTLTAGVFLFALKLIYLIFLQIRKHALPDKPILPIVVTHTPNGAWSEASSAPNF